MFLLVEIRGKLKSRFDKERPDILKRYGPFPDMSLPDIPLFRPYNRAMVSGGTPMKYDTTIS